MDPRTVPKTDSAADSALVRRRKVAEIHDLAAPAEEENPNPVLRVDAEGAVLCANRPARALLESLGWREDQPLPEPLLEPLRDALGGSPRKDFEVTCPRGRVWSLAMSLRPGQREANLYGLDVTDRRKREEELKRLNQTLRARSNSSRALMHARREAEYLKEVCRIVVEDCGHAMVWIGFAQTDEAKTVRPVAHAGFDEGYLESLNITWADTQRGRGPTGSAIRTGRPAICRHMLTDPSFAPWRAEALKRGFASSIVFPLLDGEKAFGAITIYSRQPDPFSEDEVRLLADLADDLAFGIRTIRLRAAHAASEAALRESELRYRTLFNGMTEGFSLHEMIFDPQGRPCDYRFLDVNQAFEEITGFNRDQVIGRTLMEVLPESEPIWVENYGRVVMTGEPAHFEQFNAPLGRWFEVFAYRTTAHGFACVFLDVTARKLAAQQLEAARTEAVNEKYRLEALMEALPVGVALLDPHGGNLRSNRMFEKVWGGPRPQTRSVSDYVAYKAWWVETGEPVQPEEWASARAVQNGETVVDQLLRIERFDGRKTFILNSAAPTYDAHGNISGSAVAVMDISQRLQQEERLRLLSEVTSQLLASAQPQEIVEQLCRKVMDHLGCHVFFNFLVDEEAGRLRLNACAGIPEEMARGIQWLDFGVAVCGCVARDGQRMVAECVQTSTDVRTDLVRSFGVQAYACHPLLDQGKVIGTLSFGSRLKTSFAADELALMKAVADHVAMAMQRIRFLESLERHAQAAESANVAKSQFLASMSHELRTPMNAILGMTDLALSEQLSPLVRDYLQTAKESADLLLELLNEVLDFSRIEAGRFELESTPFSPRLAAEQVVKTLAVRAYEKGLELVYDLPDDLPDRVLGDPLRLRQVLMNLVGNAIKFTTRGEVVIQASVETRTAECVVLKFSVIDTGIGIAQDDQERIFSPFTQADASTTRQYGGSGLGLAISQKLVTLMGGGIWVESQPGQGSTFHFTVTLPIGPQAALPEETGLPDCEAFRDVAVLVVADSATSRRVLQHMLSSWAMRVEVAPDVPTALTRIHQAAASGENYRLVLADAVMPGITGFTLAEWLKNDGRLVEAVILMHSAADRQSYPQHCQELDVQGLEKPISRSALFGAVAQALGKEAAACPADSRKMPQAIPERPLRILVAEDTPANQKLVEHILGRRGHAIQLALNGQQAVEFLEKGDFDVVLMDVQMPVMDGFEAAQSIRKLPDPKKATIPIIAMTAHALKGDDQRCFDAGMDAYLSKPIKGEELIERVERLGRTDIVASASHPERISPANSPPRRPHGEAEPASDAPFQLEEAVRRCFGKYELFRDMAGCLRDETEPLLREMHQAVASGDPKRLALAAHRLKGTVVYLSAPTAVEATRRVEQMGLSGELPHAQEAIDELRCQLEILNRALAPHHKDARPPVPPAGDVA